LGAVKCLIVSSDGPRREWIRKSLGENSTCVEAASGLPALKLVEEEDFDLVVCDETTQPFGAFGLSRELKVLIDPPAVIVLLERRQDVWLARWSGADRWLVAPFDSYALADAAKSVARTPQRQGGAA
jgi:DNA-binding response OmpR family regulator